MGTFFHIQRFSLYDGPGVRTVVFLKGCPLRCLWCHNPEGLSPKPQMMFNPSKCIGCMDCAAACTSSCHSEENGFHLYNRTHCISCGACAAGCCTGALSVMGKEVSPEAVMEQVLRDEKVYTQSGGGLTVSGGEPFAQAEFTLSLLRLAKQRGISTCVETSGYTEAETLRRAAELTDLFLYDYKATGRERHIALCGVSDEKILSNLKLLDELEANVILRCPIVPGKNDDPTHIRGIAGVAAAHGCIRQIHLEPYHRLGVDKASQLGGVALFDTAPLDQKTMERYRSAVETLCGKTTLISG